MVVDPGGESGTVSEVVERRVPLDDRTEVCGIYSRRIKVETYLFSSVIREQTQTEKSQ